MPTSATSPNDCSLAVQRKSAAARLGVSVEFFDKHIRPHVPVVYVGDLRLWPVEGLRKWLDANADRPYAGSDNAIGGATAQTAPRRDTRRMSPDAQGS